MFRSNLTVAMRMLTRHRVQAAINIGGLALGLAGCLMILNYVRYERSYDSWLPQGERVFQIQTAIHPPGRQDVYTQASPYPMRDLLPGGFPAIEAITSVAAGKTVTEKDGQPLFIDATTVDPDFFKVFALPFSQGSTATALPDANSVVLTESEAVRLLGTADAMGKLLSLGAGSGKRDYRVSGVLRDLRGNTSLHLGIIYRRDPNDTPLDQRGWANYDQHNYVRLRAAIDAADVNRRLPAWAARNMPLATIDGRQVSLAAAGVFQFKLVPIGAVHLGRAQEAALTPGGDPRALATFMVVASLTLAMAVINYVNLTTAHAVQRAREVALRRVFGATRSQLIAQFLGESLLTCAAAMVIALTMVELATPWTARMLGIDLRLVYLGGRGILLPAFGLFAMAGLAGGLYPAVSISRFRPTAVLHANRGSAETSGSGQLRALLVVVQFAIAIGLIASTTIIWSQTRFVERVDPGYRRDGLIEIANAWRFTQGAEYDAARRAVLAIPGITGVGRTGVVLGAADKPTRLVRLPMGDRYLTVSFDSVDADLLATLDVELLGGRLLDQRFGADAIAGQSNARLAARGVNVLVNRTAAAGLGFRTPLAAIGQTVGIAFDGVMVPSTIVGVVGDTRLGTLHEAVAPTVYGYDPEHTSQVLVRYAHARPGVVMAELNKVWRRFEPEIPFEARFADDITHDLYATERARTFLFAAFSILAVLIACLGLYGLAAFATERRTREIGIRKVLGAKVFDIVKLLAWQFSKPVMLANFVAWPIAWWAMRDWLNHFDVRIALTPVPFASAGLLALAIALATVAGHSLRVARTRPIHALRYE